MYELHSPNNTTKQKKSKFEKESEFSFFSIKKIIKENNVIKVKANNLLKDC